MPPDVHCLRLQRPSRIRGARRVRSSPVCRRHRTTATHPVRQARPLPRRPLESQYPSVRDPLLTTYPRMRWDIDKIRALPRGEWLNQSDKVEFTPSELAQLLSAPAPAARGKITAIVVPAVRKGACVPSCRRLGADEARQLLERNRFVRANNATYPAWTDLAFASPSIGNVLETLLELPTYELMFGVSADENNSGKLAHDLLQRAIGCA